jgi:hypothetical protein
MIVEVNSLCKIFVVLLMLCYTATSSVAAVHSFPAIGSSDSSQSGSLEPSQLITLAADKGRMAEPLMPCHQTLDSSVDNAKASNTCKIFCSAIGHALLSINLPEMVSKVEQASPVSSHHRFLTRQTSVDHQPPK